MSRFSAVPDSLLLLTKTTAKRTVPSEYVALEVFADLTHAVQICTKTDELVNVALTTRSVQVVAQRVVAHWNIGAGQKKVTNSYPINYIPSSADRNTW